MAQNGDQQALLGSAKLAQQEGCSGRSFAQWALLVLMWAIGAFYAVALLTLPTKGGREMLTEYLLVAEESQIYGKAGGVAVLYAVPLLLIALLAVLYLAVSPKTSSRGGKAHASVPSLWAHPVIVDGPLGVVSAAELVVVLLFLGYVTWALANYWITDFHKAETERLHSFENVPQRKLKYLGIRSGFVGLVVMSFLFIPVARGSVLLRLLDIPFEHAVKYHVWIGHFMMGIFTFHGLSFLVLWIWQGKLVQEVFKWQQFDIANLPGIIAYIAGLAMWATSLGLVRQSNFELFFYTHQLYIVFVTFLALHVGDTIFSVALGALLLFALDRFLRFCQSRRDVGLLSAQILPCGTLELVLAKPPKLAYNSLSFLFLQIPSISWLQWHPFSVSSSPYDGDKQISFLIKPLGTWTQKLKDSISASVDPAVTNGSSHCPFKLRASVEGPYGHESSYYLKYDSLVLVAGGIGVSPFIAILRDLLHRYQREETELPVDVTLIWAVKKSDELHVLDLLSPASICPGFESLVTINVQVFVTQEAGPDLEFRSGEAPAKTPVSSFLDPSGAEKPMSGLAATGSNFWAGVLILSSVLGYLVVAGLANVYYLIPVDHSTYSIVPWWVRGLIVLISIVLGVVLFGGSAIALWNHSLGWGKKSCRGEDYEKLAGETEDEQQRNGEQSIDNNVRLIQPANVHYGARPNLGELFEGLAKRLAGSGIGVLVCGPVGMQSTVAGECRQHNNSGRVAFNYHSVSFDL